MTKKVAKRATQRNAAKRAIFDAIVSVGGLDIADGLFFVTINKKYADQWEQLVATGSQIPIYNRVLWAVTSDMKQFLSSYKQKNS